MLLASIVRKFVYIDCGCEEFFAMLERLGEWSKRIHFPRVATAPLGFGTEYWDPDPTHYEGWEQLRDRLVALGRTSTKHGLAYDLASHLLDDVIVAAGGVERAITKLREALEH